MRSALTALLLAAVAAFGAPARAEAVGAGAAAERVCFSVPETRDRIVAHKLADPFKVLRAEAAEHRAEAIAVKLCAVDQSYVYVIDLLRRDGRLIHTTVDARTGRSPGARR